MKKLPLFILFAVAMLASCKKGNDEAVIATDGQVKAINAKLIGTWAVAGIPKNSLYPYSASLIFNQSNITIGDFAGTSTQRPYEVVANGEKFDINISADMIRKFKIISLTADTLKLQSMLNTAGSTLFNQTFVRANTADVANKVFRINVTPYNGGTNVVMDLNIKLNIYITPKDGTEKLALSQTINQAYTYSYTPAIGDHIRITATSITNPGNPPVFTCLAMYKGIPIGKDWQSALFSSVPEKGWDIVN